MVSSQAQKRHSSDDSLPPLTSCPRSRMTLMDPLPFQPFDSLDQLYQVAADNFCELVLRRVGETDRVNISLSGGSTPQRLYQMLSRRDLPWEHVHWFWGDERNVPLDHRDSNYRMVRQALLDPIQAPPANVHGVPVDRNDPASAAANYEQTLREHFTGDAFPEWDLALLGMGDDAHTASLFPATSALEEHDRWFVENWVEKFDSFRYTLTAPAINSARHIWFLVAGPAKKEALSHVLSPDHRPDLYPSQLIRPTTWLVSKDACPA